MYTHTAAQKRPLVAFGGKVVPTQVDLNGCVRGVSIHSPDNRKYDVKDTLLGQELHSLIGAMVEVTGVVEDETAQTPTITVNDYFLMGTY